jgi:hypothetical protein
MVSLVISLTRLRLVRSLTRENEDSKESRKRGVSTPQFSLEER